MIKTSIIILIIVTFNLVVIDAYKYFYRQIEKDIYFKLQKIDIDINCPASEENISISISENNPYTLHTNLSFKNSSSGDVFLRVLIVPEIIDSSEDNIIKINKDMININYSGVDRNVLSDNLWYLNEDGYIYYKKVINEDEEVRGLLDSITVNIKNEDIDYYKNKDIKFNIIAESVQSRNDGYKIVWNLKNQDLINVLEN